MAVEPRQRGAVAADLAHCQRADVTIEGGRATRAGVTTGELHCAGALPAKRAVVGVLASVLRVRSDPWGLALAERLANVWV